MNTEKLIRDLREAIKQYEYQCEELGIMIEGWEKYDDPSCDPGEQYSQSKRVEEALNKIKELAKQL